MNGGGFSFARVGLIAGNTAREAVRQRVFGAMLLVALALVLAVQGLRELSFGSSELKFLADFGLGALAFFGAVLAIIATAQLFFGEIEHRTVLTLLAKPVRRSEFLLGKFLGVLALLALYCAALTLLVAAVLWARQAALVRQFPEALARGGVDFGALAAAGLAQWLKLALLAAWTLLLASFARTQLFATAVGFLVLVIGHMQFFAHTAAERSDSAVTRVLGGGLAMAFPDFQAFDLTALVVGGGAGAGRALAGLAVYSAGYATVVLGLAILSFRQREL